MVNSSLLKWNPNSASHLLPTLEQLHEDFKPVLKTVFQRDENHSNSRDCPDPSMTQTFFTAMGNTKRREIQTKAQQGCQKDNRKTRESNNKLLLVFLLVISEGSWRIMNILHVPQHPPQCWHGHTSMDTTVYPISWPRILCLSTNCNIWHSVLCVQRVKLCPIKIKISTFITLYGLLPNEDPAAIVTFQAAEVPSFTNYNLTGPADAVQILVWIISLCLNMDFKKKNRKKESPGQH